MTTVLDVDTLKAWMGITDTTVDAQLATIVAGVDKAFETYLGRSLLVSRRTEYPGRVRRFAKSITLEAAPIVSITSIRLSETRDWTVDPLASTSYSIAAEQGVVYFDVDLPEGVNTVQIVYDGGMGSDVTDFISKFPDVHVAALFQAQFEYQRRKTAGASSETAQGGTKVFTGQAQLLDITKERLAPYRRIRLR